MFYFRVNDGLFVVLKKEKKNIIQKKTKTNHASKNLMTLISIHPHLFFTHLTNVHTSCLIFQTRDDIYVYSIDTQSHSGTLSLLLLLMS